MLCNVRSCRHLTLLHVSNKPGCDSPPASDFLKLANGSPILPTVSRLFAIGPLYYLLEYVKLTHPAGALYFIEPWRKKISCKWYNTCTPLLASLMFMVGPSPLESAAHETWLPNALFPLQQSFIHTCALDVPLFIASSAIPAAGIFRLHPIRQLSGCYTSRSSGYRRFLPHA